MIQNENTNLITEKKLISVKYSLYKKLLLHFYGHMNSSF